MLFQARAILLKTRAAMGGRSLGAIKNMTASLSLTSFGDEGETQHTIEVVYAQPMKILQRTRLRFGEFAAGFDGRTAWAKDPRGITTLSAQEAEEARALSLWMMYDVLRRIEGSEYDLRYDREEKAQGQTYHVVLVKHRTATVPVTFFIDAESKLIAKKVYRRSSGEESADVEEIYTDYRTVGRTLIPFKSSLVSEGVLVGKTEIRSVKLNSRVTEDIFRKPRK